MVLLQKAYPRRKEFKQQGKSLLDTNEILSY